MKNNGTNPIKDKAHVKRAWVAAFLDEPMDKPMHPTHTTPLKNNRNNYGNILVSIMTNAFSKIKVFIVNKPDRLFTERTQTEIQT